MNLFSLRPSLSHFLTLSLLLFSVYAGADNNCLTNYQLYKNIPSSLYVKLSQPEASFYDIHFIGSEGPFQQAQAFKANSVFSMAVAKFRVSALDRNKLPPQIINENVLLNFGITQRIETNLLEYIGNESLRQIYQSYEQQGPERKNHMTTYQNEDLLKADRTTHFLLFDKNVFSGRIQVQQSLAPNQLLNVEEHFPESTQLIARKIDGGPRVELGRLFIPKNQPSKEISDPITFYELFLRSLLFSLKTVAAKGVIFQTNQAVLNKLNSRFSLYKSDPRSLSFFQENQFFRIGKNVFELTPPAKSKQPIEYLTVLTATEAEELLKITFIKRTLAIFSHFLNSPSKSLHFSVHPEEKFLFDLVDTISYDQRNLQEQMLTKIQTNLIRMGIDPKNIGIKLTTAKRFLNTQGSDLQVLSREQIIELSQALKALQLNPTEF